MKMPVILQNYPGRSLAAKKIFPNNLTNINYDSLTNLQREFLYENGAARTLFYLGMITRLYKSISKESSLEIDKKIEEGDSHYMTYPREKALIECAKEAAKKHPGNTDTVLVVFGGGHVENLKAKFSREVFEYLLINTLTPVNPFESTLKRIIKQIRFFQIK